jgi:HlyD family secretion protein
MDIQREGVARRKGIRAALWVTALLVLAGFAAWRVSEIKPAVPAVERATLLIDTVKRGDLEIEVRGLGTLVPEDIIWIPAEFESQVRKILVKSGQPVKRNTVLMILENPDMELAASDLEWQVRQAEAAYSDLKVRLESQRLDQQANVAAVASELRQAELTKDRDEQLLKAGLKSDLEVKLSVARWEQLEGKHSLEKQRLDIMSESINAQLDSQKLQIDKLRAALQLKRKQVSELTVRAGMNGVIQEVSLQVGQRVTPGMVLAKVAEPRKLKAELKIPETQAKDIAIGQAAEIDTRNGVIPARVVRIDPNVVNGTRTVDCQLQGKLPRGAVPDLSVEGRIEIARLTGIEYVGRPVLGQPNGRTTLFKIEADGKFATRVGVSFGLSSVNSIQVLEGLKPGDQVILSDMSAQEQFNRIALN